MIAFRDRLASHCRTPAPLVKYLSLGNVSSPRERTPEKGGAVRISGAQPGGAVLTVPPQDALATGESSLGHGRDGGNGWWSSRQWLDAPGAFVAGVVDERADRVESGIRTGTQQGM